MKTHSSPVHSDLPDSSDFQPIHIKGNCPLNPLTAAQQQSLLDWLELYPCKQVPQMVAAPPPEGFGINTHLTTLRPFHLRARARGSARLVNGGNRNR